MAGTVMLLCLAAAVVVALVSWRSRAPMQDAADALAGVRDELRRLDAELSALEIERRALRAERMRIGR